MAIICFGSFPKRSANLIFSRLLRQNYYEQKLFESTASRTSISRRDAPVKFTTNKAASVRIEETTGLLRVKQSSNRAGGFIIMCSLGIFMLYFCVLREENDVDELLRGEKVEDNDSLKLIQMKLQLKYCEQSGLPTKDLQIKIKELEDKLAVRK